MTPGGDGSAPAERWLWLALGLVLAGVIAVGTWSWLTRPERLPVLGTIPDFVLEERSGSRVTASDLRGRIWVADFIFTRCGGVCPVLTSAMADLQGRLGEVERGAEVRLVSLSVDPAHDRPELLRAYAERFHAGPGWLFLTGERDAVYRLVRDGFQLSVAEAPPGEPVDEGELITHSDRFAIVDRDLRVRAYHHGTDPGAIEAVLADLRRLAAE